ncbi:MAG: nucleoside-diphosphate kinase [Dehalococcoidia bacterium]|tara:strand:- start:38 stop:490 length:453 start_codon:yes stop_codon:yes gene_type:complete
MERTLVLLKPDTLQRNLVGPIISRLEQRGLTIIGLKLLQMDNALASKHYSAHVDKPFFGPLVEFITSGPIVAIALQGKNSVAVVRNTMGSTNPVEANPGTIRGDFGIDIGRNLIHGSDSVESAQTELGIFFENSELLEEYKDISSWIIES